MKKIFLGIIFALFVLIVLPRLTFAAGDYCAGSRVINQWGCKAQTINLCSYRGGRWAGDCPLGEHWCDSHSVCNATTDFTCDVVYDGEAPCNTGTCQTTIAYNECSEGASWQSSCNLFNSGFKGCNVLAYSCSGASCNRDAANGTYYNAQCDNACSAPPQPSATPPPGCVPGSCNTSNCSSTQCGNPCGSNGCGTCSSGTQNCPVPTTPPSSGNPTGYLENMDCTTGIGGWAGDPDDPNFATNVHVYFDLAQFNDAGADIGAAQNQREAAVCQALGGANCNVCPANASQCKHGYYGYQIPAYFTRWNGQQVYLRDGNPHTVTAFGINKPGTSGVNTQLTNISGSATFTCPKTRIQGRRLSGCPAGVNTPVTVKNSGGSTIASFNLNNNYSPSDTATNVYTTAETLDYGANYTVSFTPPAGYSAEYSTCSNCINHTTFTAGNSVTVTMPNTPAPNYYTGYQDVYWRCVPLPTPTPQGTIRMRAWKVPVGQTCANITTGTAYNGAIQQFSGGPAPLPGAQTQSGSSYSTFTPLKGGGPSAGVNPYTANPQPPAAEVGNWTLALACWASDKPANHSGAASGTGATQYLSNGADLETLTWDIGFTPPSGWFQTAGADVYGAGGVFSNIPLGVNPRKVALQSGNNYPGVVSYGNDYDFAIEAGKGPLNISSYNGTELNWIANDTNSAVDGTDLYAYFWKKLGAPTTTTPGYNVAAGAKPGSNGTYYINGPLTIGSAWNVTAGQSYVMIVNGALSINNPITITGTGSVIFIVNGDITVAATVGNADPTLTTSNLDGIYIAHGAFNSAGSIRLVARGIFVAQTFSLTRTLGVNNASYSAYLFSYLPQLLFSMPELMKDVPIKWQEIAP